MSKFKVGDRVMVRHWDDMAREYETDENESIEPFYLSYGLKKFCGKQAVVSRIVRDLFGKEILRLKNDNDSNFGGIYGFCDEMLVLVEAAKEESRLEKAPGMPEEVKKEVEKKRAADRERICKIFNSWRLDEYITFHTERAMLADYLIENGVKSVAHGKWLLYSDDGIEMEKQRICSECRHVISLLDYFQEKAPPYCEICGAKMDLEEKENGMD